MTYLTKPKLHHPGLPKNSLGLTRRDYEGAVSTLCAGCGHDSISAAIIQAFYELAIPPHRVAKLSGIGCSSKTPTYFLSAGHGFNSVHGRMPSVATGAALANRDLIYLGVSGDGDSASIGLGQFAHCMRRGVNMVYVVENNGVYGLTKGQFSATADKGSKAKRGAVNRDEPIDLVQLALVLGATFVARGFGDKAAVPLIKAAVGTKASRSSTSSRRASRSTTIRARRRAMTTWRAQRGGQPARLHARARSFTAEVPAGAVAERADARRRHDPALQAAPVRCPRQVGRLRISGAPRHRKSSRACCSSTTMRTTPRSAEPRRTPLNALGDVELVPSAALAAFNARWRSRARRRRSARVMRRIARCALA
jgi:hypothetical protein